MFCHPSADDERKDINLQKRIRSFNWITNDQLEVNINTDNKEVENLIGQAQQGMANGVDFISFFQSNECIFLLVAK